MALSIGAPIAAPHPNGGSLEVIGQSGVPAMHAALMQNGRVVFLDKVENYTQLQLPDGFFAYSSEFDPDDVSNLLPLQYGTNAFCSGGIFLVDGRLLNIGGNAPLTFIDPTVGDGFTAIRYLNRTASDSLLEGQGWDEPGNKLSSARWYPSAQIGPDGSVFVASGSLTGLDPANQSNNNPTYEILDAVGVSSGISVSMDILVRTQPYHMYPFLHLLPDGNLFVFAAKSSEIWSVQQGSTVRPLPDLAGMYRTYPNTGGSVLLPLSSTNAWSPEVVVCGGGAYQDVTSPADASCGRIAPLSVDPSWEMDVMPEPRVMVEGTLLPDGTVVWVNGGSTGSQGFGLARDPAYEVLIYDPAQPLGQRFTTGPSSSIARLYHSVALLLLDGTMLIAGSNPVEQPILEPSADNPYVTEFRVERYTPPYLSGGREANRPTDIRLSETSLRCDSSSFTVTFTAPVAANASAVVLYYGGFITHSLHMGHRMVFLDTDGFEPGEGAQTVTVAMPPNCSVAPPGPYVVFVTVDGTPGQGQWVAVS